MELNDAATEIFRIASEGPGIINDGKTRRDRIKHVIENYQSMESRKGVFGKSLTF